MNTIESPIEGRPKFRHSCSVRTRPIRTLRFGEKFRNFMELCNAVALYVVRTNFLYWVICAHIFPTAIVSCCCMLHCCTRQKVLTL